MNKNKYTIPPAFIKIHSHIFLLYKCLKRKVTSKYVLILKSPKLNLNTTQWLKLHFAITKVRFYNNRIRILRHITEQVT